jgi:hypothetical protein
LNSLNPFILDYLSAARSYGIALAFWTLGAYYAARWAADRSEQNGTALLVKAGVAFGLAVSSHLTEAFAVAGFEAALIGMLYAERRFVAGHRGGAVRFLTRSAVPFAGATLVVSIIAMWMPLRYFRRDRVDGVMDRYLDGIGSIVNSSLLYKPTVLTERFSDSLHRMSWILMLALFGALALAAARILHRWLKARRPDALDRTGRLLLLFSTAVLLTFVLLWIEPKIFGHGYFAERRLLFTLPLIFTAGPLWLRWVSAGTAPGRAFGFAGVAGLVLLVWIFALEFNVKSYSQWEFDAGTKRVMEMIRQDHSRQPKAQVRVGADWFLSDSMDFYRAMYGLDWMAEVTRDPPACYYDYYYVMSRNLEGLKRFDPRVLYRDDVAKTVLAVSGGSTRQRLAALHQAGFSGLPPCTADIMLNDAWVEMGRPGAERHFLHDVMGGTPADPYRWTFERPALLFQVPKRGNTKFKMDLVVHGDTFKKTGPLRMTVWLNGKPIGQKVYDSPEKQTFQQEIAPEWLRSDGLALVETTLDTYYVAPADQRKLGYLFVRGGFVQ